MILRLILISYLCVAPILGDDDCGDQKIRNPIVLIHGEGTLDSYEGQWPWLVSLFKKLKNSNMTEKYFCGASLINERTLLSAAHCFKNNQDYHITAYLGAYNLTDLNKNTTVRRTIEEVKSHPKYNFASPRELLPNESLSDFDIAILIMNEAVNFTDYIQPICMPSLNFDLHDKNGIAAGHGTFDVNNNAYSDTTKHIKMKMVNLAECLYSNNQASSIVSKYSMCAIANNSAPCRGDSGSGFYYYDTESMRYTILGIVSFSIDDCKITDHTVFTQVTNFMEFIIEKSVGQVNFPNFFLCNNGNKILFQNKCNGIKECPGGEDEINCLPGVLAPDSHTFTADNKTPIRNENFTIKHNRTTTVTKLFIDDFRKIHFLPIRIGEIFPNIQSYSVQYCAIETLAAKNFKNLKELKILDFRTNWIKEIEGDAFFELIELTEIYLNSNEIQELPKNVFKNSHKLRIINLRENEIMTLEKEHFMTLFTLEYLNIKHNKLKSLKAEYFENNKSLHTILLMGNEIGKIEEATFDGLEKLKTLDLRCNKCFDLWFNGSFSVKKYKEKIDYECKEEDKCD